MASSSLGFFHGWLLLLLLLLLPSYLPKSAASRQSKAWPVVVVELQEALPKGEVVPSGASSCTHNTWIARQLKCPLKKLGGRTL
ncbi:hypothetical protein HPP92_013072 [Vanilla planifolia]|uniref:Uncharacterized protein n=1 Tax=Vanilla planifolia TaxID=51239 RepID=A0A835R1Q3_VANPL|nr:hypothetical protein HPP92_013072 [Vanilla planifolia]